MKLGFLVSGRGSNMLAIIEACERGELVAEPAVVISNNPAAAALQAARQHGIPACCLDPSSHPQADDLDRAITDTLRRHGVELVVLAGYMKKVGNYLLKNYRQHVINIHPSLLPQYGGKGMYGMHVHQAVLNAGESQTGVTIHQVNEQYDQGRILAQQRVNVLPGDTAASLAERVLAVEHTLYVAVIRDIISGHIDLASG